MAGPHSTEVLSDAQSSANPLLGQHGEILQQLDMAAVPLDPGTCLGSVLACMELHSRRPRPSPKPPTNPNLDIDILPLVCVLRLVAAHGGLRHKQRVSCGVGDKAGGGKAPDDGQVARVDRQRRHLCKLSQLAVLWNRQRLSRRADRQIGEPRHARWEYATHALGRRTARRPGRTCSPILQRTGQHPGQARLGTSRHVKCDSHAWKKVLQVTESFGLLPVDVDYGACLAARMVGCRFVSRLERRARRQTNATGCCHVHSMPRERA
eukprot:365983-Chlamydomonas_euryale.AAC.17